MSHSRVFAVAILGVVLVTAKCTAGISIEVTGDNVNLRAAPLADSEVVFQASRGDVLVTDSLEGEWIGVVPPHAVDLWVYGELVKDGVVAVPKLRVRAGRGINYRPVGVLAKGARVEVRGEEQDWLKIAPPPGSVLWVSSDYVQRQTPVVVKPKPEPTPQPKPKPVAAPAPKPRSQPVVARPKPMLPIPPPVVVTRPPPVPPAAVPPAPREKEVVTLPAVLDPSRLVASKVQGKRVALNGILRRSWFVWRRPSRYRLVRYDGRGRAVTSCYVLSVGPDLERHLDTPVTVSGKLYWIQGVRHPAVLVGDLSRK